MLFHRSYADLFPLSPAGGLFLTLVGTGILLGALFPGARIPLLAAGGVLGILAATFGGALLAQGHGNPTTFQVDALIFAIAIEMAVLPFLRRWLKPKGLRTFLLGILTLVGAHFILMAPAFGVLIVLLGLLTMANALAGLKYPAISFDPFWALDGGLKVTLGALLLGSAHLPPLAF
jgi:hypothetical protein